MAKIDKTGDAAIMPLHKILMKMCGQTGYTPDAVFEGLLDYIIGYLNPSLTPEPMEQREQCRNTFEHCRVATEVRESEQSQESGVSDFTPETPLSDPVQTEKPKGKPVQLTLF